MEKLRQIGKGRNNEIVSEWTHLFFFYFFGLFVFIFFFVWHNSYYQYFFFFIRNYRGIYEWMFSTHSALCHILWGKKKKKKVLNWRVDPEKNIKRFCLSCPVMNAFYPVAYSFLVNCETKPYFAKNIDQYGAKIPGWIMLLFLLYDKAKHKGKGRLWSMRKQ